MAMLAGALLWASAASAQVPGEEGARRAFEEGVALEKTADYAGALTKFKESEALKPTLGNRYHKAYCLEMTGKLAAAMIEYEVVDKAAREANKADLVEATRIRLEPLRPRVPQLSLKLDGAAPQDTEVSLDGSAIAPALLDGTAFRVDPGAHVVTAQAAEHAPFTKSLSVPEGTTASIEIVLQRTAAATTDRFTEPPAEEPPKRSIALPVGTTAVAIVLAAGGTTAFVLAGNAQGDLERSCAAQPTCEDDKTRTRTLDALALGAWVGAAGLAALSVVLWTTKPSSATAASAKLVGRSSWLGVEGRF